MQYNVRVAEVLRSISRAGDVASARPFGFSQRLSWVATTMARSIGMTPSEQGELVVASLLHGVGMAGVSRGLSRLQGGDERTVLERFPVDLLLTQLEHARGRSDADETQETNVFHRHLLELGQFPEVTKAWLEQVGLVQEGLLSSTLLECEDGHGVPKGLNGSQMSIQSKVLRLAYLMTSARYVSNREPLTPFDRRASKLLDSGGWLTVLSGSVVDATLVPHAVSLWEDTTFWTRTATRERSVAPFFDLDGDTNEASLDPKTTDLAAPQTEERHSQGAVRGADLNQLLGGYVRGRHDVDEDVADVDRLIDELLYPKLSAFLEPSSPQLKVWLDLMAQMTDARDAFSHGHSARVADLCLEISLVLGLSDEDAICLSLAARVYRVGRLCLPGSLLMREFQGLSELQRRQLHTSPYVTQSILAPLKVLSGVIEAAASHTERFDGSGFPGRRTGVDIPLTARILAVADTYISLISPRPYRKAHARSRALAIIQAQSGSLFDGLVTDALEAVARGQL